MNAHSSSDIRVNRDEEHLRLLARYHWLVCILYFVMLILTVIIPLWKDQLSLQHVSTNGALLLGRLIFLSLYVLFSGMNAWCLQRHKAWLACCILSIYECTSIVLILDPLGIILGISAILKLRSDSVKEIFHKAKNAT
jgi:hypothetical protein